MTDIERGDQTILEDPSSGITRIELEEPKGVFVYDDEEVRKLSDEFNPLDFPGKPPRGREISGYSGDFTKESAAAVFLDMGMQAGRYYGLDENGFVVFGRYLGYAVFHGKQLPNVRVENYQNIKVYFPTITMLEKMRVGKRDNK